MSARTAIDIDDDTLREDANDPFAAVRENEAGFQAVCGKSDARGALARVMVALAADEQPSESDLETAGFVSADRR